MANEVEVDDIEKMIKDAKKRRSTAQGVLKRRINAFYETRNLDAGCTAMERAYEVVQRSFCKLEDMHEKYVELLEEEDSIKEASDYIESFQKEIISINIDYDILVEKFKQELLEKQRRESVLCKSNHDKQVSHIKIDRMKPPKFYGNVREFPIFLSEYERNVVSSYGEDPFVLKSCLEGEALQIVKGVDDQHDEMMKRLKDRYGDYRTLSDVILNEIKKLTPIAEDNHGKFIKTIQVIEKAWLDLRRMKLKSANCQSN